MPSIIFITSYYTDFMAEFYRKRGPLSNESYNIQLKALLKEHFGDSDFYSSGMRNAGWSAEDIISNCSILNNTWAVERGLSVERLDIIVAQIQSKNPDVIYLHDLNAMTKKFLEAVRPHTRLIVGQIATPIFRKIPFSCYDIIFSSFPHYVSAFRKAGITAYHQPLAFDPRVINSRGSRPYSQREIACSFVGGISKLHLKSYELLERLAKETPIVFWGYGSNTLSDSSYVAERHRGEAWGRDMFRTLLSSKININRHGEVAESYANNMRLFEATGCGALLITDHKDNLNELFEIGKEIVAYRSPEECVALVKYFLNNSKEAEEIARAGQERTLRSHTYTKRMEQTAEILERHLRYKREKGRIPLPANSKISYGHTLIQPTQVTENMTVAWKNESIPERQRALVQKELEGMYGHKPPQVYHVLADCLNAYTYPECSILEIGCASGYYYEVLEYLLKQKIDYTGVDYSIPLISMAKDYYPNTNFHVADGANLPFKDRKFFTAISSCILLHVPNYQAHIKETVRVAERFVVSHRTPICRQHPTQYLKKFAYGVETVELIFNEKEIVSEFLSQGLKLIKANQYFANEDQDRYEVTYLFKKIDGTNNTFIREKLPKETQNAASTHIPKKPMMLNLGCGGRFNNDWVNIDFHSNGPQVKAYNLCRGIPESDEVFDVVYHSHLLEHFPKKFAPEFLNECYRVLKPGGILRVVQPDLEQIVRLYLDLLGKSLEGDSIAQKRYEWILLEFFDQMVRNRSGGEMLEYWKQNPMPVEDFVIERCGSQVLGALLHLRKNPSNNGGSEDPYLKAIQDNDQTQIPKIASFRMSGEVHQWMYDRYSLKILLQNSGFIYARQCKADESLIPDFNSYLLDIEKDGRVRKPDSFFMEAVKPN